MKVESLQRRKSCSKSHFNMHIAEKIQTQGNQYKKQGLSREARLAMWPAEEGVLC